MPAPFNTVEDLRFLLSRWPHDPEGFAARAARVADWNSLLRQAEQHGVLGMLHEPLLAAIPLQLGMTGYLQQRRQLEQLWEARLGDILAKILHALAADGLRTVVLKGPVLGERLYGDASLRRSTDLDLLVAPSELERALAVLQRFDYTPDSPDSVRYHQRFHHHYCLSHRHWPPVEVHFRLYVGYGVHIPAEQYLERAVPYHTHRGAPCFALCPEDELVYLALHAAGHDFTRLGWLYDLKVFLSRASCLQWDVVRARVRALGTQTAFAFAAAVLQERLEWVDPDLACCAAVPRGRLAVARRLLQLVESFPPGCGRAKLASLMLQAWLCDRASSGGWVLQHHLLRMVRRRVQRRWPQLVPAEWSG